MIAKRAPDSIFTRRTSRAELEVALDDEHVLVSSISPKSTWIGDPQYRSVPAPGISCVRWRVTEGHVVRRRECRARDPVRLDRLGVALPSAQLAAARHAVGATTFTVSAEKSRLRACNSACIARHSCRRANAASPVISSAARTT